MHENLYKKLTLQKSKKNSDSEEELDGVELVPNIILNPGFCDSDGGEPGTTSPITRFNPRAPYHNYRNHRLSADSEDDDIEEPMTFSRKMSIFFTGNTIKRI